MARSGPDRPGNRRLAASIGARPGLVFPGRRGAGESWEWIYRAADAAAVNLALAGVPVADPAEIERRRITAAIPSVPVDIGPGELPNEGGLEADAISYSKGCYLGQEVMARLKSTGRVRRTLVRVRGTGSPPPLPAVLWRGENREGELRSAAPDAAGEGYDGLALVSTATGRDGGGLAVAAGAAPTVEIARRT